jgi:Glycosyltransferase
LIEAIGILKQKGYNIKYYLFGDGPLRKDLEKTVNELNLENIIIFKGAIPHNQLLELYANNEVDCVILPSIVTDKGEQEGIPVSLMEAMAYKIPVISTNTGGIPELLDNDAGIIVEQRNSYELAEAIELLIRNKELRIKLGEKGYKKVAEEFYLPKIVTKLLEFMRE